jgi:RNase P subunit RPR2
MSWIVWSIRSWFCKHEWNYEEKEVGTIWADYNNITTYSRRVSATCRSCGWHRRYKKF